MIYYFSGTGNSERIARMAADLLSESVADMADSRELPSCAGGTLGLVMPVYAWGIPAIVERFIAHTLPRLAGGRPTGYTWCILTHGDDMGYADAVLRKRLAAVGIGLDAVFSLSMPNTYVCLPGFDVDAPELAMSKAEQSGRAMDGICRAIANRERATRVTRGVLPHLKTYAVRPLFNALLVTDRYFHIKPNTCVGCGRCAHDCPLHNITIDDGRVEWHGDCTGCLRCYHNCPCNAIQFGRFTRGKGQKNNIPTLLTQNG